MVSGAVLYLEEEEEKERGSHPERRRRRRIDLTRFPSGSIPLYSSFSPRPFGKTQRARRHSPMNIPYVLAEQNFFF